MHINIHSPHMGRDKTLSQAKDIFYWPAMNTQVAEICEQCDIYPKYSTKQNKRGEGMC